MSPRRTLFAIPLALLAVTALAACGGDSGSTSGTTAAGAAGARRDRAVTVSLRETDLGKVLVDAGGRTLYAFTPDSATTSACTGGCARVWPPDTAASAPTAGTGVTASLATITRDDGTKQVVAGGHPLYRYAADTSAGGTTGQGSGGKWYVVSADGSLVTAAPGSSSGY